MRVCLLQDLQLLFLYLLDPRVVLGLGIGSAYGASTCRYQMVPDKKWARGGLTLLVLDWTTNHRTTCQNSHRFNGRLFYI